MFKPPAAPVPDAAPQTRTMLRFALLMCVYYVVFDQAYQALPSGLLHDRLYLCLFGQPTAELISLVRPDEGIVAFSNRIGSPLASLEIVRGCDGSGVLFLVCGAVLAFPATWRMRVIGLCLGAALVYTLNLLRLGGLYFILAYRTAWFQPVHTFVLPTLLVVIVALYYLAWLGRATPERRA